jgi:hypothetical protein
MPPPPNPATSPAASRPGTGRVGSARLSTWPGAPGRTRDRVSLMSLPVRSGFCSEPESANSLARIFSVKTNHE